MKLWRFAVVVTGLALSAAAAAQQMPRQDGRWKVQIQMQLPNMPTALPPMTMEQCLTPEDVKDPMQTVPRTGPGTQGGDCKMTDYQVAGSKVTWKMECTGSTAMTGTGEMVYADNAYAGTMTMNVQGQTMTAKVNGVRLGDCTR